MPVEIRPAASATSSSAPVRGRVEAGFRELAVAGIPAEGLKFAAPLAQAIELRWVPAAQPMARTTRQCGSG